MKQDWSAVEYERLHRYASEKRWCFDSKSHVTFSSEFKYDLSFLPVSGNSSVNWDYFGKRDFPRKIQFSGN